MTTKANELIETVRKALEPKYEFPYYALVRIHTRHHGTFHIPAPYFNGMGRRSKWAGNLPIASDKRDGEYYECPFCGEKSFYSGVCPDCVEEINYDYGEDAPTRPECVYTLEYRNHEAVKTAVKEEFLRRLDSGIELGIIYAEIVLPVPWGAEWEPSPFLKSEEWSAERALEKIESVIRTHEKLKENEEYQKMIHDFKLTDGVPLDYIEGDEIVVEGTDEIRRYQNDIWQHKHPDDGYDYWHPMARVHKESKIYPMCLPSDED